MSELGEYLAAGRMKPWAWREHDCSAFPAIWAGFADALPGYADVADAEAVIREAGGLTPLWEQAAEGRAEEVALDALEPGDIGVIELPTYREAPDPETGEPVAVIDSVECGAIWTGRRWAFVPMGGGVAAVSAPPVIKVWRPLCRR